ncbi:hypothetical protein [uncultured Treponema sp.]|uniref:hypothetical protein n=1 Tax=uncultured Treponema sp. TaxID=162155 RepID=UPI0025DA4C03|nr:hypothetical protein [uncultured Treponema sp.]
MVFDKSKVYTALNADEIKPGSKGYFADNLKVLKEAALSEDSVIFGEIENIYDDSCSRRFNIKDDCGYHLFYLIEEPQEKKLRPYKDTDEMVEDFKKRFNVNVPPYAMPLIWVKTKGADKKYLIVRFASALTICLNVEVYTPTLEDLAEGYTYLDGSPCGIEE